MCSQTIVIYSQRKITKVSLASFFSTFTLLPWKKKKVSRSFSRTQCTSSSLHKNQVFSSFVEFCIYTWEKSPRNNDRRYTMKNGVERNIMIWWKPQKKSTGYKARRNRMFTWTTQPVATQSFSSNVAQTNMSETPSKKNQLSCGKLWWTVAVDYVFKLVLFSACNSIIVIMLLAMTTSTSMIIHDDVHSSAVLCTFLKSVTKNTAE